MKNDQELIDFIDSTQMDDDIKKAMRHMSEIKYVPKVKLETLLKRGNQCLSENKELIQRLPREILYAFIFDYMIEFDNRDKVVKDFDYIKNEKDVFYLIKPHTGNFELIIINGISLEPLSKQDKITGFLWGYSGSGTNTTARVILKECFPGIPNIFDLAIDFSFDMLGANKLESHQNGIVKKQDVLDWYKSLNIVKRACKELGLTQKELADVLGVSKPSVERWAQSEIPEQSKNQILLLLENTTLKKELSELKSAFQTIAKYVN